MEMEPGVMATISVSTRRSSSVARDRVDFAVRMSDTVEGTALRTTRRFSLPSLHILHVRCKFCVIRAVGRSPQFLHV